MASLEEFKRTTRAILISKKSPILADHFPREYCEIEGQSVPWASLGYRSLLELLKAIPDTVKLTQRDSLYYLTATVTDDVRHIHNLVRTQKPSSKSRGRVPPAPPVYKPPQPKSVPQQQQQQPKQQQAKPPQTSFGRPPFVVPPAAAKPTNPPTNSSWSSQFKDHSTSTWGADNWHDTATVTNNNVITPTAQSPSIRAGIKSIRNNLIELLVSHPDGMRLSDLPPKYESRFKDKLDFKSLGFSNLKSFIQSLGKDVYAVEKPTGSILLYCNSGYLPKSFNNKGLSSASPQPSVKNTVRSPSTNANCAGDSFTTSTPLTNGFGKSDRSSSTSIDSPVNISTEEHARMLKQDFAVALGNSKSVPLTEFSGVFHNAIGKRLSATVYGCTNMFELLALAGDTIEVVNGCISLKRNRDSMSPLSSLDENDNIKTLLGGSRTAPINLSTRCEAADLTNNRRRKVLDELDNLSVSSASATNVLVSSSLRQSRKPISPKILANINRIIVDQGPFDIDTLPARYEEEIGHECPHVDYEMSVADLIVLVMRSYPLQLTSQKSTVYVGPMSVSPISDQNDEFFDVSDGSDMAASVVKTNLELPPRFSVPRGSKIEVRVTRYEPDAAEVWVTLQEKAPIYKQLFHELNNIPMEKFVAPSEVKVGSCYCVRCKSCHDTNEERWYRAVVEAIVEGDKAPRTCEILYVDSGYRTTVSVGELFVAPLFAYELPPQAYKAHIVVRNDLKHLQQPAVERFKTLTCIILLCDVEEGALTISTVSLQAFNESSDSSKQQHLSFTSEVKPSMVTPVFFKEGCKINLIHVEGTEYVLESDVCRLAGRSEPHLEEKCVVDVSCYELSAYSNVAFVEFLSSCRSLSFPLDGLRPIRLFPLTVVGDLLKRLLHTVPDALLRQINNLVDKYSCGDSNENAENSNIESFRKHEFNIRGCPYSS